MIKELLLSDDIGEVIFYHATARITLKCNTDSKKFTFSGVSVKITKNNKVKIKEFKPSLFLAKQCIKTYKKSIDI